jgi:hypothetical protein
VVLVYSRFKSKKVKDVVKFDTDRILKRAFGVLEGIENDFKRMQESQKGLARNAYQAFLRREDFCKLLPDSPNELKGWNTSTQKRWQEIMEKKTGIDILYTSSRNSLIDMKNWATNWTQTCENNIHGLESMLSLYKSGGVVLDKRTVRKIRFAKEQVQEKLEKLQDMNRQVEFEKKMIKNFKIFDGGSEFVLPHLLENKQQGRYFPKMLKDFLSIQQESNMIFMDNSTQKLAKHYQKSVEISMKNWLEFDKKVFMEMNDFRKKALRNLVYQEATEEKLMKVIRRAQNMLKVVGGKESYCARNKARKIDMQTGNLLQETENLIQDLKVKAHEQKFYSDLTSSSYIKARRRVGNLLVQEDIKTRRDTFPLTL